MQTPPLPCHTQLEMSALVFFVSSIDPSHPMGLIIFLLSNLPQPFTLLSLSTIEAQSTGTSMTLAGWGSISGLGAPDRIYEERSERGQKLAQLVTRHRVAQERLLEDLGVRFFW